MYLKLTTAYLYPQLLSPKKVDCGCLPVGLCVSPRVDIGQHMREGVGVHDMHCGLKSYKLKLNLTLNKNEKMLQCRVILSHYIDLP